MNRLEILEMCEGNPTKFENLYFHYSSVFEFVYVDEEFIVEARNCRDLKFKLSLKGITLVERQVPELSCEVSRLDEVETEFVRASDIDETEKIPKTLKYKTGMRKATTRLGGLLGTSPRELALRREMANKYQ